ncbi:hypothetical protein TWF703_000194 [Orbilia oligospora]|uniref:alpha-galactosidase n=1 Tax=Orbilia oligospora TaxID=2813651 RepID=A0A7C8NWP2_ORBOL|nr:hypothetical protein TWF703_000194 [Orbilia oligospora]
MHLIGRRASLLSILAASGFMLFGAPGAMATPITPGMDPIIEESVSNVTGTVPGGSEPVERAAKGWWVPTQATTWQIQLSGTINQDVAVDAIEIDADTDKATVKTLKAKDGWPGEKWLDIRQISTLRKLMKKRVLKAKAKGFDGVDWDNVDGYTQDSGFKITKSHQLAYNKMLADISHSLKMTVALKNDLDQAKVLARYFDYAVNEQCSYYNECNLLEPFLSTGKAVVGLEYPGEGDDTRTQAQVIAATDPRTYTLIKKLDLGDWGFSVRQNAEITSSTSSKKKSSSKTTITKAAELKAAIQKAREAAKSGPEE